MKWILKDNQLHTVGECTRYKCKEGNGLVWRTSGDPNIEGYHLPCDKCKGTGEIVEKVEIKITTSTTTNRDNYLSTDPKQLSLKIQLEQALNLTEPQGYLKWKASLLTLPTHKLMPATHEMMEYDAAQTLLNNTFLINGKITKE